MLLITASLVSVSSALFPHWDKADILVLQWIFWLAGRKKQTVYHFNRALFSKDTTPLATRLDLTVEF